MLRRSANWHQLLGIVLGSAYVFSTNCATAQITPDKTLPNNSSVTINGSVLNITGGTQAGRNLFHSFQEFSVPTGGTASFNNGSDIHNIISRVTGGSISNIDGLIKASGTANLFFLNPNGIVFGPNASLNIGGSFVATTANAIGFGKSGFFSATNPNTPPLLTVNPDALLFNQIASGTIKTQSIAPAGLDPGGQHTYGLRVPNGRSLLLVGGDISGDGLGFFDPETKIGGGLNAFGGRVELGGLAGAGTVGLNYVDDGMLSLSFPNGVERANVSLSNQSTVKGGNINITARSLSLTDQAALDSRTNAEGNAGDVIINTSLAVSFDKSYVRTFVDQNGRGNGGEIRITTPTLSLTNGSNLYAATQGQGNAGNVILNGTEGVKFDGNSSANTSVEGGNTGKGGKGGDIRITTGTLELTNEGQLLADTNGMGNAGNVMINADTIKLDGRPSNASGIFSRVLDSGRGNGGDISITTGSLSVTRGAGLFAFINGQGHGGNVMILARDFVTFDGVGGDGTSSGVFTQVNNLGIGHGANLHITTGSLKVSNQAQLIMGTAGDGDAGNVIINASKSVSLDSGSGIITTANLGSSKKGGDIMITTKDFSLANGARVNASTDSTQNFAGRSGDITINTDTFRISNGAELDAKSVSISPAGNITIHSKTLTIDHAQIAVSSEDKGETGNIKIFSDNLTLLNQAQILGETGTSSKVGNIELNLKDFLLLRQGSRISTNAGTKQQPGNGGNITINAPNGLIVAAPNEKSDITANAFSGSGGRVQINATGIYGLKVFNREDLVRLFGDLNQLDFQKLPSSITAISQTSPSLNGQVNLNTNDVDPSRGLVQLPTPVVDTPRLISSGCAAASDNSFTITGRGGLPPSPSEPLSSDVVWTDTRLPATMVQQHQHKTHASLPKPEPIAIIPATGWVFNNKGEVTLISRATNGTYVNTPFSCPAH